jgi:hypothetical protein
LILSRPHRVAGFWRVDSLMLCSSRTLLAVAASMCIAAPGVAQQRASLRTGVARAHPNNTETVSGGARPQQPHRPSRNARVALQFLAGSAGAVGGGIATYLILRDVSDTRVEGDEGYTRSGNVGYLVGSFAGATLGAHLAGRRMGGKSPLWATALGSLVGTVPLAALGIDEPYLPLFGIVLGWIPQGALAAAGFTMAESR